jgi:hypothetical protein
MSKGRRKQEDVPYRGLSPRVRILLIAVSIIIILAMVLGAILPFVRNDSTNGG